MSKLTKVELVSINARLAAENEDLRKQVADLTLTTELLYAAHGTAPRTQRTQYAMPQWQQDRAAAMQAARAMAMQSHCVVKV